MSSRPAVACFVLLLLACFTVAGLSATALANDDLTVRMTINGEDISLEEAIVIDPGGPLEIDLRIINGESAVTLSAISVEVIFAGYVIMKVSEPLADTHLAPGELRTENKVISIKDALGSGERPVVTGIYHSRFSLEYTVNGIEETWSREKDLKIPGNPLTTPAGAAGAVTGIGAIVAILAIVKSVFAPALSAGTVLPAGASLKAMPGLREFAGERLEATARGRTVGGIVNSAKRRIVKQKCPICESHIRHGHCFTCRKSAGEVQTEYVNMLRELAVRGGQLIDSGETTTVEELCSKLNISSRIATDVVATLRHAGLVKVKGIARKVTGKAVTMGICCGLSAIIWITVGGFAVLSTPALAAILAAAIVIPFAVSKGLQIKAGRAIKRDSG